MHEVLAHPAPRPARGSVAPGFEPVAARFATQLESGRELGASFCVYHRGRCVVDLYGGFADAATKRPWEHDTRVVLFSVTKGFAAMAMHLLADRGLLDWDSAVAEHWPLFARAGKGAMSVRTLLGHRGGLPYLDTPLKMQEVLTDAHREKVRRALEDQAPAWVPGQGQGYHAITFGMYAGELFERVAHEPMGPFLRRELFAPLGSDVHLGTPASEDARFATLYPPKTRGRVAKMLFTALFQPDTTEGRVARATLAPTSIPRRAFLNPKIDDPRGVAAYNEPPIRRAELPWGSASGSARGVARAYLPFASGGVHAGRRYLKATTLSEAYARQGWSDNDLVLQKPLGWSNGFLKEERHVFSPTPESFGHAGMGGALGWADPVEELAIGYAMNRMDWRVRSPRALGLCHALYECEPVRASRRG